MNEKIKDEIKNAMEKGEGIARKYNPETLIPFPFKRISNDCDDLALYSADLSDIEKSRGFKISGYISFNETEKKFEIYINKDRPKVRMYFTLAHEIGHYFLHKESLKGVLEEKGSVTDADEIFEGNPLFREDGGLSNVQEASANAFAASLLMPEERVRESFEEIRDIEECAKLFQVSWTAMSIRLEKLKLSLSYE